jgi:hypothetical protein
MWFATGGKRERRLDEVANLMAVRTALNELFSSLVGSTPCSAAKSGSNRVFETMILLEASTRGEGNAQRLGWCAAEGRKVKGASASATVNGG